MEYETKTYVVRWSRWREDGSIHGTYHRFFKNPISALRRYRKLVKKDILSAKLIRIDVNNVEHIIDSLDKHFAVTYTDEYITKFKWEK